MSSRAKVQATRVITLSEIPDKMYFRIGEVASIVDVKPYVLRYWETEFPALRPQKSRSRQRMYRRRDVELLLKIKHLLYDRKYTIAGARQLMKSGLSALPEPKAPEAPSSEAVSQEAGPAVVRNQEAKVLPSATSVLPPDGSNCTSDAGPARDSQGSSTAGWQLPAEPELGTDAQPMASSDVDKRDQLSFDLCVPLAMRADLQKNLRSMISFCDEAEAQDRGPFDELRRRDEPPVATKAGRAGLSSDG